MRFWISPAMPQRSNKPASATPLARARAPDLPLASAREVLILASIVERENSKSRAPVCHFKGLCTSCTTFSALQSTILRTARPGARVVFRTAAEPSLLPGRVPQEILNRWDYAEEESRAHTAADRSSIYGGVHLYVLKGAAA